MFKPVLGSKESGIGILHINTRITSGGNFVSRHASVHITSPVNARNIRDARDSGAIDALWLVQVQRDDAASACKRNVRSMLF